jgi:hypothetical protein
MNLPSGILEPTAGPSRLTIVRRRWNDPAYGYVQLGCLREVRLRNDPGGVCSQLPRAFLIGRLWCDQLAENVGLHVCKSATAPHELEVCVLEVDNGPELLAQLRARAAKDR